MSPDRVSSSPSPNSPLGAKLYEKRVTIRDRARVLNDTTAYHGAFTLPPNSETVNFSYLNPALEQLFFSNNENNIVTDYLQEKLKTVIKSNNWETEPNPSFIASISQSEADDAKFLGLSIEKIGDNQFHLTGRNITNKEVIRQQKIYEKNHDPQTGYLNSFGWKYISDNINHEKRVHLKPKKISIFYFDLTGVKEINDTVSHEAGDKYIIDSFHEIAGCFRRDDIIARIHDTGDELIVCLPDIEDEKIDIISQKLNSIRNDSSNHTKFYFGAASATLDSFGNFNFSDIINEADIKQLNDKKLIKQN